MVFNLNIMDLTIAITSWNKSHFIYIKNNFNKKLSTISLRTKLVKLIKCTGLKKKKKLFGEQWSHAPLFTTVASFHRAESRQELLLIFSRFKRCSTWDPLNSNSRSCVTKQLVASNRRKRGRHHVAKRTLSQCILFFFFQRWTSRSGERVA